MTSPLLALPGAVPAEGPDAGLPWHFGDPLGEQRRAEEAVVVTDRSNRGLLRVTGEDRLSWLHSLTTQHLLALPPWTPTQALVLDPHGRVEHHLQVVDDGTAVWLDVEPGTADRLLGFLDKMRFLLRVEVEDASGEYAAVGLLGPGSAGVAAAVLDASPASGAAPLPGGGLVRAAAGPVAGSLDLLLPRTRLRDVAEALVAGGAAPAGTWAADALRIAARTPRLGWETDHKTIPHEVGWLHQAVHLDKGCYRGQETVARVHNLGRPPRRLVLLHLDGSEDRLPAHAAPVLAGDRPVGFVGTAGRHHELGPVALALVKRSVPDDEPLLTEGLAARVDADQGAG